MRTTVTFPDTLYRKAQIRMKERDFIAFADYLQHLIREDTKHLPPIYHDPAPVDVALNERKESPTKQKRHIPRKQEN